MSGRLRTTDHLLYVELRPIVKKLLLRQVRYNTDLSLSEQPHRRLADHRDAMGDAMGDSILPASQAVEQFSRFPDLPRELQLQIWEYYLPVVPQTLEIRFHPSTQTFTAPHLSSCAFAFNRVLRSSSVTLRPLPNLTPRESSIQIRSTIPSRSLSPHQTPKTTFVPYCRQQTLFHASLITFASLRSTTTRLIIRGAHPFLTPNPPRTPRRPPFITPSLSQPSHTSPST